MKVFLDMIKIHNQQTLSQGDFPRYSGWAFQLIGLESREEGNSALGQQLQLLPRVPACSVDVSMDSPSLSPQLC